MTDNITTPTIGGAGTSNPVIATNDLGGGQNVGYIDTGDWMSYSVDVPATGGYKISYRIASATNSAVIQLEQAGGTPM